MDSDSNLKQVDVGIAASHWRDWLRLCMTPLLGFHAQKVLIDALGGPRQVFEQPIDMLRRFVSEAQAQSLQVIPTEWSAVCERTEVWLQQTPQGVLQEVWTSTVWLPCPVVCTSGCIDKRHFKPSESTVKYRLAKRWPRRIQNKVYCGHVRCSRIRVRTLLAW